MARTVYFAFHYQRDIMRAQVVKQHYVTKGNYRRQVFSMVRWKKRRKSMVMTLSAE
jgi:hypothetical protein